MYRDYYLFVLSRDILLYRPVIRSSLTSIAHYPTVYSFNRQNSQLRDGTEDMAVQSMIAVGCYLLSNILNMDQTPLPWEYLEGKTYKFKANKTVWVRTRKSGWDKRQATIQLTIFADGIDRVMPLIIFRGTEDNTSAPRRREEKLFDSQVVVKFNPKGYANSMIILFWLEFMLLPILNTGPTLLVMDLFKSHSTQEIKDWLRAHRIVPSLVPGGCTGLVQPPDVSVNRPFKDILKQVIDDTIDLAEGEPILVPASTAGKKDWQSEASKMRVMMTKCVGEAWEIFNREKRDVVIRSFRCLGIALPIDGSCDNEISIKGLDTTMLVEELKNWKQTPTQATNRLVGTCASEGTSDSSDSDSGSDESGTGTTSGPSLAAHTPTASSAHKLSPALAASHTGSDSSEDGAPLRTTIKGNRRGRPRARGHGRGTYRSSGKSSNSLFSTLSYLIKILIFNPLQPRRMSRHSQQARLV